MYQTENKCFSNQAMIDSVLRNACRYSYCERKKRIKQGSQTVLVRRFTTYSEVKHTFNINTDKKLYTFHVN